MKFFHSEISWISNFKMYVWAMICIPNSEKDTSKIQNNYGVLKLETKSNLNKTKQEPLFGVKVE